MVTMVWYLANNNYAISYYYALFDVSKTLVKLVLNDISCHCNTKWHYCIPKPTRLCIKGSKER